jgi:hypothetical protein
LRRAAASDSIRSAAAPAGRRAVVCAYPWSNPPSDVTIDCSYANYCVCNPSPNLAGSVNRVGSESPKGDGRWGQADLAGNDFEYVLDSFINYTNPCSDCSAVMTSPNQGMRSGCLRRSWRREPLDQSTRH